MANVTLNVTDAKGQATGTVEAPGAVSGGGKKPWKQKGTGRARQGSTRAPQWYHGGVVHGPGPRKYDQRTPKKMKTYEVVTAQYVVFSKEGFEAFLEAKGESKAKEA